jgi:hypothetical protein
MQKTNRFHFLFRLKLSMNEKGTRQLMKGKISIDSYIFIVYISVLR